MASTNEPNHRDSLSHQYRLLLVKVQCTPWLFKTYRSYYISHQESCQAFYYFLLYFFHPPSLCQNVNRPRQPSCKAFHQRLHYSIRRIVRGWQHKFKNLFPELCIAFCVAFSFFISLFLFLLALLSYIEGGTLHRDDGASTSCKRCPRHGISNVRHIHCWRRESFVTPCKRIIIT